MEETAQDQIYTPTWYPGSFAASGARNVTIGRTVLTRIGVRPVRAVER